MTLSYSLDPWHQLEEQTSQKCLPPVAAKPWVTHVAIGHRWQPRPWGICVAYGGNVGCG